MKRKRTRLLLTNLALTLMLVLLLLPAGTSGKTTQPSGAPAAAAGGDCMSQCHMDMSDCLGNGGGYSCIESFYGCSAGCNQLMQ